MCLFIDISCGSEKQKPSSVTQKLDCERDEPENDGDGAAIEPSHLIDAGADRQSTAFGTYPDFEQGSYISACETVRYDTTGRPRVVLHVRLYTDSI